MSKLIYIADDEKNIRQLIETFLTKEGFQVQGFGDGESLLAAFQQRPADLLILDIMMPGMDGLSLCASIRQTSNVPIIIVSAKDSPLDRVTGITLGSDDYLVKPFLPLELVARVKALFRRSEMAKPEAAAPAESLAYCDLTLDLSLRTAQVAGREFSLTPTEFDFLAYLLRNSSRAISREELLKNLWQLDQQEPDTRAADDLVKRLRKKLREQDSNVHIETVWGFGFRLACEGEAS